MQYIRNIIFERKYFTLKPLIVLVIVFILSMIIGYLIDHEWPLIFSGNLAMCMMLLFTSIGHFKFRKGMIMMMPQILPAKREAVLLSGLLEILLGILLLFTTARYYAGVALLLMFIIMLPVNISAAMRRVNYEKATFDGPGLQYLWFRIPMQLLLIAWVGFFSL